MSQFTPERPTLSVIEGLEAAFNLNVLEIATLLASGRVQRVVLPMNLLQESDNGHLRLSVPKTERE